jgi:hypothetical protein
LKFIREFTRTIANYKEAGYGWALLPGEMMAVATGLIAAKGQKDIRSAKKNENGTKNE